MFWIKLLWNRQRELVMLVVVMILGLVLLRLIEFQ